MRIAIIGSGIAGLAAARSLKLDGHHVSLFEKQSALGMAVHGFEVDFDGQSIAGDVPSRMFNASLWPNVWKLYRDIGIETERVNATQNYRQLGSDVAMRLTIPLTMKNKLSAAVDSNVRSLLSEMWRLQRQGSQDLARGDAEGTFAEYLKRHQFETAFIQQFLYPAMTATVCTCSDKALDDYPASILLEGMKQIVGDDGLWRVTQGSKSVVDKLGMSIDRVYFDTLVTGVVEFQNGVEVKTANDRFEFDRVICATQANHVGRLCPELPTAALAIFEGFDYEDVKIVIHTDRSVAPQFENQWDVFNFAHQTDRTDQTASGSSMCSVWLNQFHRQWPEGLPPIFQTIKPIVEIDPATIICRTTLQRPIVTETSWARWNDLREFNQHSNRLKFCGSYAVAGIPLLESAVVSAEQVCSAWNGAPK